jgi:hypothetical protein
MLLPAKEMYTVSHSDRFLLVHPCVYVDVSSLPGSERVRPSQMIEVVAGVRSRWLGMWIGTRWGSLCELTQISVYLRPHSSIHRSTRDYYQDEPGEYGGECEL